MRDRRRQGIARLAVWYSSLRCRSTTIRKCQTPCRSRVSEASEKRPARPVKLCNSANKLLQGKFGLRQSTSPRRSESRCVVMVFNTGQELYIDSKNALPSRAFLNGRPFTYALFRLYGIPQKHCRPIGCVARILITFGGKAPPKSPLRSKITAF
jgi:hypothetical protein